MQEIDHRDNCSSLSDSYWNAPWLYWGVALSSTPLYLAIVQNKVRTLHASSKCGFIMRKKNQVSAVVSPADSTHGANAWQKAEEPHESPTSAGSDEPHDESMDMDTLIDEPERIVQHSIRRFKRYSRSWAALSLHASNHRSAHPLVDLPSTQILEEEMGRYCRYN